MVGQSEYTREIVVLIVTDGNNKCNYVSVLGIRSRTMKIGQGRSFFMRTPISIPTCPPARLTTPLTSDRAIEELATLVYHIFFFLSSIFSTTIIVDFFLCRYDCNNTFDDHRHSLVLYIIV